MVLAHEYIKHRSGYSFDSGACWLRVYRGEEGDAPVVVCEKVSGAGGARVNEMASQLAAEVIKEHFPDGLPDLPRPMIWIEHRLSHRGGSGSYFLLDFPSYVPRPVSAGFTRRVSLGAPTRHRLEPREVARLTGEEE